MNPPADPAGPAPEHLWFFDTLVCIRTGIGSAREGLSLLEHHAACGDSPPLHVHHTEDEIFYILEGELRFVVGGREYRVAAGETLTAPHGIPHTYRVESVGGARWLTITQRGDFERFVRRLARPALQRELPIPGRPPSEAEMAVLVGIAGEHQIEFRGPPLGAAAAVA